MASREELVAVFEDTKKWYETDENASTLRGSRS